jgi:hypothetical protein
MLGTQALLKSNMIPFKTNEKLEMGQEKRLGPIDC